MTDELEICNGRRAGADRLNRPKAINALSLEMIEGIIGGAAGVAGRSGDRGGAVRGAGEKGFCSGGDVRAARAHVVEGRPEEADRYFATEYRMNAADSELSQAG